MSITFKQVSAEGVDPSENPVVDVENSDFKVEKQTYSRGEVNKIVGRHRARARKWVKWSVFYGLVSLSAVCGAYYLYNENLEQKKVIRSFVERDDNTAKIVRLKAATAIKQFSDLHKGAALEDIIHQSFAALDKGASDIEKPYLSVIREHLNVLAQVQQQTHGSKGNFVEIVTAFAASTSPKYYPDTWWKKPDSQTVRDSLDNYLKLYTKYENACLAARNTITIDFTTHARQIVAAQNTNTAQKVNKENVAKTKVQEKK